MSDPTFEGLKISQSEGEEFAVPLFEMSVERSED